MKRETRPANVGLSLFLTQIRPFTLGLWQSRSWGIARRLLDLADENQRWRLKTVVRKLVHLAGRLSWGAQQWIPRLMLPRAWLRSWQSLLQRVRSEYGPVRLRVTAPAR